MNCSGALILSQESKRFLFLQRTQVKTLGMWGLVGGKSELSDKSPIDTLSREISEELGSLPEIVKIIPLDLYTSNDSQFEYNTYVILVKEEFIPLLNGEHSSYAWCKYSYWPKPLHNGVKLCLNNRIIKTKLELLLELI